MFKNYLAITLRNIRKNKSYIFINTFGLGIALACCITSYILLAFNLEFDNYYEKEDVKNLYRVHTQFKQGEFGDGEHLVTPFAMGPAMQSSIAGVESFTRFFNDGGFVRYGEKSFSEGVAFADSAFTSLVPMKILKGNIETFGELNTIFLSEESANKIFPDENPIGKVLTWYFPNQTKIPLVVGAVYEDVPLNTTLTFNFLARIEHIQTIYKIGPNEWGDWRDPSLLGSIPNRSLVVNAEKQLQSYVALRNEHKDDAKATAFTLESFLDPANQDDINWSHFNLEISDIPIIIFISMAGIILLIACFNLTNTSVALTAKRFKEVGVRKVAGATKGQIIVQFLFEMALIVLMALLFGLVMSRFIVQEFTDMWGLPYGLENLSGVNLFITLIVLVFIASLIAGIYPALMSTKFQPVLLIKNQAKVRGNNWFTKSLVTAQFTLSIIVLINGIVFTQNTRFQEKLEYGFNYRDILAIFIQSEVEYDLLKGRAAANPKVQATSITHHQLGMSSYPFPIKIDTTEYQVQHIEIGENFMEIMGLDLSEGRFPNINNKTDELETIVVNRTFLDKTGIKDPLNEIVIVREQRRRIIGVVEDHVDNLFRSKEPEPFVYYASKRDEYQVMLVQANADDLPTVKDDMEKIWDEAYPERPFQGQFQEEILMGNLRGINSNMKKIFIFLTILGGLLSVSGIFALASLNVERRTKEIGIRKALGGSIQNIVKLLSKEFIFIMLAASLLGGVGGYFITDLLLDQIYAYHIDVKVLAVLFGVLIISVAGLATTSTTIFKAAQADPVKTLRDE